MAANSTPFTSVSNIAALLENLQEGVQVIGRNYEYLYLNAAAVAQSKFKLSELLNHKITDCYPGIESTELFQKIRDGIEKNLNALMENEFTFPDGTKEWYELRFTPVPEGVLILSLNVSKRKRIEVALLEANKERAEELLNNAAKMSALGEMASGVAHEINNPLSIIMMQAQSLLKKSSFSKLAEEELREGLKKITVTAERIGSVIKGLSAISRNSENDPKKEVTIESLIESTLQLSHERYLAHNIPITKEIITEKELRILCHPPQILQVLINLLNNSFDAIQSLEEKWVKIRVWNNEKKVYISVTDSGLGIPKVIQEKIMQPFFTTKESGKGTGLGLSISKKIIEEHGGSFLYDTKNTHTTFVIELPKS